MDRNYKSRVLERRQLIVEHPSIVIGVIPQGQKTVQELYAFLMSNYLPQRFPKMFSADRDGNNFRNIVTGANFPVAPPEDPLEALKILAETIEDDMFLLHETEKGHRSVAYVCCYCSGFDPSQKLDKLLDEIHQPVPSYHKIGPSMERFFSRVEVGKNVKRVNVSNFPIAAIGVCRKSKRSQHCKLVAEWKADIVSVVVCGGLSHSVQLWKQPRSSCRSSSAPNYCSVSHGVVKHLCSPQWIITCLAAYNLELISSLSKQFTYCDMHRTS